MRPRHPAQARSIESERVRDSSPDLLDVPAAVVCAACGDPACLGCSTDEATYPSGIVAIVPWERSGTPVLARMWHTAKLATTQSSSFFGALPDGDLASALVFALLAETLAVSGLLVCLAGTALLVLPELLHVLRGDPRLLTSIVRGAFGCLFGLVVMMVGIHSAHGFALDFVANRRTVRKRARGLRFGLYACGWDLVTLPAGLLALALLDGPRAARRAFPLGLTAPMQAAEAYLVGVRGIALEQARVVARRATMFTGLAVTGFLITLAGCAFLITR
ncbi:MAG TPA: hypothetical protein VGI10_13325 [Polyangiaceae bacterium]|jgi:hypothetical protein